MCCKCATVTDAHITTSISVLECPILQTMQPFFILSSCSLVTTFLLPIFFKRWWMSERDNNVEKCISFYKCGINVVEIMTEGDGVPVQVITTSICRMTSLSLTTLKPSMLHRYIPIFPISRLRKKRGDCGWVVNRCMRLTMPAGHRWGQSLWHIRWPQEPLGQYSSPFPPTQQRTESER